MHVNKSLHTNQLIHETSPYLLQHAHNPVNWYPWGETALKKAREEEKLIIISIGYSACHWCHVMERESFENDAVAEFMNNHFVSIKVDREERPDIDQVYMNAVQLLSGRGGWPLNCLALPDGRPIYGGTYFPKEQWMDMLKQVHTYVKENPEGTEEMANRLTHGIRSQEAIYTAESADPYNLEDLEEIFENWKHQVDFEMGGSRGAPKFPLPSGHRYLLFHHYLTGDKEALRAVKVTLDKMAHGGIFDQIGGGFARYSVDATWKVPHFEKMLYDNAQLVSLYSEAYRSTGLDVYRKVAEETVTFVIRELRSPEGAFWSALDADSEGEEGKYYVWTSQELKDLLGDDAAPIMDYFGATGAGNWEKGVNILLRNDEPGKIAARHGISLEELELKVSNARVKLLAEREKRVRPGLDDKILASWNAMMISGLVEAYKSSGKKYHLDSAVKTAGFILEKMQTSEGGLFRSYKEGKATIHAFLDDYAFFIASLISLYQVTFDEKWLISAKQFTEYVISHFHDKNTGMLFYTSDQDPELIARKMEVTDNVIPAASSEMAKNLFLLGHYFEKQTFVEMAKKMLDNVREHARDGAMYYSNWDVLMAWFAKEPYEVAITGPDAGGIREKFHRQYLPDVILMGGQKESTLPLLKSKFVQGKTMIYVCEQKTCRKPTEDFDEAMNMIRG